MPVLAEADAAATPLYTTLDAAQHLRLPVWLILIMRGRLPFPFVPPEFFCHRRWLEDAPRLSFLEFASMFVNAAAIQVLLDARDREKGMPPEPLFFHVLERLRDAAMRPFFAEGEPTGSAAGRLSKVFRLDGETEAALQSKLAKRIDRVEMKDGKPARLFPFTRDPEGSSPRLVVLDPRIRFGRPTLLGTGLPTDVINERYLAGDSVASLAEDYGTKTELIEEAIRYEGARCDPSFSWWGMEG